MVTLFVLISVVDALRLLNRFVGRYVLYAHYALVYCKAKLDSRSPTGCPCALLRPAPLCLPELPDWFDPARAV